MEDNKDVKSEEYYESASSGLLSSMQGEEIWKPIKGADTFEVSNMGNIRSLWKGLARVLSPQTEKRHTYNLPRLRVYLDRRKSLGWVKYVYIHKVVAKEFLNIEGKISFIDGNPFNCKAENLCRAQLVSRLKEFSCLDLRNERWKHIQDSEYLQVSDMGRIRDASRDKPIQVRIRIWKHPNMNGAICVAGSSLPLNGFVHRLVARAFLPNPENYKEIKFKNGDTTDSKLENLVWSASIVDNDNIQILKAKKEKTFSEIAINNYINGNDSDMKKLLKQLAVDLFWEIKKNLNVKNDDDVNDAVQHTLLEILKLAKRGKIKGDINGYAYTIAKHKIYRIRDQWQEPLFITNSEGNEYCKADMQFN